MRQKLIIVVQNLWLIYSRPGRMLAILATFFEILTSNLFRPPFTLRLKNELILKLIELNLAIHAYKNSKNTKWPYLKKIPKFLSVSTINIFARLFFRVYKIRVNFSDNNVGGFFYLGLLIFLTPFLQNFRQFFDKNGAKRFWKT